MKESEKCNQTDESESLFDVRYRFSSANPAEVQAAYAQVAEFIRSVLGSDTTSRRLAEVTDFETAKARHQRKSRAS